MKLFRVNIAFLRLESNGFLPGIFTFRLMEAWNPFMARCRVLEEFTNDFVLFGETVEV